MTYSEICSLILNGTFDDAGLRAIQDATRTRQKINSDVQAQVFKATVQVGQKIRFTRIRPAYLNGQTGSVVSTDRGGKKVMVRLDSAVGKFGTNPISCPANCLEIV